MNSVDPADHNVSPQPSAGEVGEPTPLARPASIWSLRDLAWFVAFAALALMVSNFVTVAGYAALKPLMGWHTPTQALPDDPFFLLVLQSVFYGFLFAYVYGLVVLHYRRPFWTGINWRKPTLRQTLRFFLGGVLLAVVVGFAPRVLPDKGDFPLERMFSTPEAAYAVGAFAVLIAPVMEELLFRGVVFSVFETRIGLGFAVVSTAALFAGLHVPEYWGAWNHVLLILVVGMVFSLARGLTGSLAPSVILHLGYNASLVAGLFFATHHFRTLQAMLTR